MYLALFAILGDIFPSKKLLHGDLASVVISLELCHDDCIPEYHSLRLVKVQHLGGLALKQLQTGKRRGATLLSPTPQTSVMAMLCLSCTRIE